MKKLLLIIVIALLGVNANAQDGKFNFGASAGIPTGTTSTGYSFGLGLDVNYIFNSGEDFTYGIASGVQMFFGKTLLGTKIDNATFLPIAAVARYKATDKISLGADIGYSIGIAPSANKGGFYYKPVVGYSIGDNMELNAFYSGVSVTGGAFSSFGVGVMFGL